MTKPRSPWLVAFLTAVVGGTILAASLGHDLAHGLPSLSIVLLGLLARQAWQVPALAALATLFIFFDPNFEHSAAGSPADFLEHGLAVSAVWVVALLIHWVHAGKLKIASSGKRLRQALDAAMDAIISIDEQGRVTYFNDSAAAMFGLKRRDILGQDLAAQIIPPQYRAAHKRGLRRAVARAEASAGAKRVELTALRADGSEFPIELTISESHDRPKRFTAFIRDLTHERRITDEMKRARDEAIAANTTKTRFLTHMSRDLRTPLTTILGYTQMLLSGAADTNRETQLEYLGNIGDAGEKLQETVDRLLAISQASSVVMDANAEHRHLFDLAPDMICVCRDDRISAINEAGVDMIGANCPEDIIGRMLSDFVTFEHATNMIRGGSGVSGDGLRFEATIDNPGGEPRFIEIAQLEIEYEGQPAEMFVGRDITKEKRAKRELNNQRDLFSILHETAVVANNASSPEEAIGEVLAVVCAHTGWPVGHAYMMDADDEGTLSSSRIWHFDDETPYRELRQVTEATHFGPGQGLPGRVLESGAPLWIPDIRQDGNFPRASLLKRTEITSVFAFPVLIVERVVGVLEFFTPRSDRPDKLLFDALNQIGTQLGRVIERERAEALLIRQANFDPLTELPNRALAMDRLTQALQMASRDGQSVVVVSVDLDDFKKVNDTLGHTAGDRLIIEAARRLERNLRKSDTVASLGGDEFLVIFKDIGGSARAGELADKLLASLRQPFDFDGTQVFVSASLGIAVYPEDGDDAQGLLRQADIAMFSAKSSGRDTYRFFSPEMNADSQNRLRMDTRLRYALDGGELFPVYQPIVETVSGHPMALETLLRWENPELGFVRPDQFIPLAESSGEIIRIGSWLIDQACRDLRHIKDQGFPHLRIAINISPKQFMRGAILTDVRRALAATGLAPADLELEVTEGLLMIDTPEIIETLHELHAMGVGLSIDDFGTGYSSLSYLRRYPFDTLKIDKSFVDGLHDQAENAALVAGIISMSHAMGLKVICEGVETPEELRFLEHHDGDFIQGYLFGKPQTLAPAAEALKELVRDDLLMEA